jgi:hypothetical protein
MVAFFSIINYIIKWASYKRVIKRKRHAAEKRPNWWVLDINIYFRELYRKTDDTRVV